jgi:hypothetical protein
MKRTLVFLATTAVLAAGAANAQTLMPQADVEAALKGGTFAMKGPEGFTAVITFNPDMTLALTATDGAKDSGTYRFAGGGYCSTWVNFRSGEEACFTMERLSDEQFQLYTLDGKKDDLFTRHQAL